jgi:hypothetical protein
MALLSLRLGGFFACGTAGADFGKPGGMGRVIAPGSFMLGGMPPTSPPPPGPPMFIFMLMFMLAAELAARAAIFMRCSWRALAFCMISDGRLFALGVGLLELFSSPVTLEVELM